MSGIFQLIFLRVDSIIVVDLLCAKHCACSFSVQEWEYHLRLHTDSGKRGMEKTVVAILRALRVLFGHLGRGAAPVGPAGLSPWHVTEGLFLCLSGVTLGQKT